MPEATVHEDDQFVLWQYDVRLARQVLAVQPEPIAEPVQRRADEQFRLGVLAADAGHVPASTGFGDSVHLDFNQNICATTAASCTASSGGTALPT